MNTLHEKRQAKGHKKDIIAYLACKSCGKWWGLRGRQLACLLCPWYFTCPMCHQGRTNASAVIREWPDRADPTPPRLDTRLAPASKAGAA